MKEHACFKKVNRRLKRTNTELTQNLLNRNQLFVATHRITKLRDGKKATVVIAAFCPFCGDKLEGT